MKEGPGRTRKRTHRRAGGPVRPAHAEDIIKESERQSLSIWENSLDAILLTTPDGGILAANPAACRMFERTEEELRRLGRNGIIDASDPRLPRAVEERARTGAFRGELKGLRRDGSAFPIELSTSIFMDLNRLPRTSMVIRDITERKRAEEDLRLQSTIVRTMAEGVCLVRAGDAVIVYANPRFEEMFGYGPGEMNGMLVERVNAETGGRSAGDAARAIIAQLERSGEAAYEILNIRKDGTTFWCRAHTTALDHPELGRLWVAVHEDITERKRTEEELKASRDELWSLSARLERAREEEKANIAREIHDELGQKLTGLIMDLSMLERKIPDSSKPLKERAAAMIREADGLVKTVRRIATGLRPGILDDMGLVAAIEWQVEEFAARTGIPSACDCRGFSEEIDPARAIGVFRILQEALTNVARHARARNVRVEFREESGQVVLCVEDDGRGISPAEASGVGTLGLAGMRERARLLGGGIRFGGSPGKGTSVELRFPREAGRS